MPTSNGQVGTRQLREASIVTAKIFPEAITAELIEPGAVGEDQLEEPTETFEGSEQAVGLSLSGSVAELVSVDVEVPDWAGLVQLTILCSIRVTVSVATALILYGLVTQDGALLIFDDDASRYTLADTGTFSLNHTVTREATVTPSSTYTVTFGGIIVLGTLSNTDARLNVTAVFSR